jgi:hypothetical protein
MLLNLNEMPQALRAWQISKDLPKATAIGLTGDGVWATSYLKEYPPALCAGLAHGFCTALLKHPVEDSIAVKSVFVERARSMIVQEYGHCAGPDYAK